MVRFTLLCRVIVCAYVLFYVIPFFQQCTHIRHNMRARTSSLGVDSVSFHGRV